MEQFAPLTKKSRKPVIAILIATLLATIIAGIATVTFFYYLLISFQS
jgi:flagellar basal body-associated protein FliL